MLIIHLILCQISAVKGYKEEAKVAYATLLDIEGKTEEAIATLETVNTMSSVWHLAQVFSVCFKCLTAICNDLNKMCFLLEDLPTPVRGDQ